VVGTGGMYKSAYVMTLLGVGLFVFSGFAVATPLLLHETGRYGPTISPGIVNQITIAGNYMYASLDDGGFEVIDRNTGTVLSRTKQGNKYAVQFVLRGNYAYVADWYGGLTVIDISNKNNVQRVGSWSDYPHPVNAGPFAEGVGLSGNNAFLSINGLGVVTLDITDPLHPVQTGFSPETLNEGALVGVNRVINLNEPNRIVVRSYKELLTYDISDPNNLVLTSHPKAYPCIGAFFDSAANDYYVGLGSSVESVYRVYDMSNPDNPLLEFTYKDKLPQVPVPQYHYVWDLLRCGHYLFVAEHEREVLVMDISNPLSPQKVAYFPVQSGVTGKVTSLALDGKTLYVGTLRTGIIAVDVSAFIPEPATILLVSSGILGLLAVGRRRLMK